MIRKTFGCVRFIYNQMLAERQSKYEANKEDKEKRKHMRYRTPAGFKTEFDWSKWREHVTESYRYKMQHFIEGSI